MKSPNIRGKARLSANEIDRLDSPVSKNMRKTSQVVHARSLEAKITVAFG